MTGAPVFAPQAERQSVEGALLVARGVQGQAISFRSRLRFTVALGYPI
jgi:hypothetical protein